MLKLFSENHGYIGPYQFISSKNYASFPKEGTVTSSYSDVVPITRRSTTAVSSYTRNYFDLGSGSTGQATIALPITINTTASALQTAARKYKYHSRHFTFNSSVLGRNLLTSNINFVFIPTIYYGSTIKRGSVVLDYYITGSKIASCHDKKENGELYYCFDIALLGTGMSEEELNKYSDEQILAIAVKVMEQGSKKK